MSRRKRAGKVELPEFTDENWARLEELPGQVRALEASLRGLLATFRRCSLCGRLALWRGRYRHFCDGHRPRPDVVDDSVAHEVGGADELRGAAPGTFGEVRFQAHSPSVATRHHKSLAEESRTAWVM